MACTDSNGASGMGLALPGSGAGVGGWRLEPGLFDLGLRPPLQGEKRAERARSQEGT